MARERTCVHDREYLDSFAVNRENNRGGPLIAPMGSWCFMCDGKGKNGSWKPVTFEELKSLDDEHFTERDDEPPSLALPRRVMMSCPPIFITGSELEARQASSRLFRHGVDPLKDEASVVTLGRKWAVADWSAEFSSYRKHIQEERDMMSFKRATYTVPRSTRQVELKFETPITHLPHFAFDPFPRRIDGIPPRKLSIDLEMPGDQERVLIITDEQEMTDFENFRKLKDLNARIKKANAEILDHEEQQERCERAAGKAYEEKSRLVREQTDLKRKAGIA